MTSIRKGSIFARSSGKAGVTRHPPAIEQEIWNQEIRKLAEEVSRESRDSIARAVREALEIAKEKSASES